MATRRTRTLLAMLILNLTICSPVAAFPVQAHQVIILSQHLYSLGLFLRGTDKHPGKTRLTKYFAFT